MKTLETVLADLTGNANQKKMNKVRCCEGCGAKEGAPHPIRGFEVILQTMDKEDAQSKQVCVICRLDQLKKEALKINSKKSPVDILKQYGLLTVVAVIVILFLSGIVQAQPSLPSAPDQAPIDGGLTLLAAAGGAYAIKRLRGKKESKEL